MRDGSTVTVFYTTLICSVTNDVTRHRNFFRFGIIVSDKLGYPTFRKVTDFLTADLGYLNTRRKA